MRLIRGASNMRAMASGFTGELYQTSSGSLGSSSLMMSLMYASAAHPQG
jgi:hypothetical protein